MRMIRLEDQKTEETFARQAAKWFAENKDGRTYTESGKIKQGELFAIRWGLGQDCVVVFKIDEFYEVTNYQNIIKKADS